ncbi:aldo/keto reductase [Neomegalonema sp.]|uniref:aldo/keto reductase n=1 Tax=Neomegalonema sp. TaxID=2039713 RepID=UPI00260B18F4|nr:aldo/keto reductase [Neomegalonema sp.]MDD2869056.1 aldo/keto reductase [Neomegalonema sp.]
MTSPRPLGRTGLDIQPLIFGGNVFGWTLDEAQSFAILDAFLDHGFDAVDTADVYSVWVPGNHSESERIIGRWMKARGARDKVKIFTKVGMELGPEKKGLSARWIAQAVEDSLKRLQTDRIDLYQSHTPDPETPQEETLRAYEDLVRAGKVRHVGASNFDAAQLGEALKLHADQGLPRYETLQNEYNLLTRHKTEGAVQDLAVREGIGLIPFYALSAGFLTGKYRSEADFGKSPRGAGMARFLTPKGLRVLAAMDEVAASTGAAHSEIALAWLLSRPGVTAPIASATSVAQLESLVRGVRLKLSEADLAKLTAAGEEPAA